MITRIIIASIALTCLKIQAQTTVLYRSSNNNIKDAWIWSFDPFENVNFGKANTSNSGLHNVIRSESWIWGTPTDTIRGLISFDLSDIPSNAVVMNAKLSLFFFANSMFTPQTGQNDLVIQRIDQSWSETGVVWTNQPSVSTNNQVTLAASSSTTQDYPDIDVTNLIQDMIDNPASSDGFMLKMLDESPFRGLTFASSEHTDTTIHPTLEITYNTPVSVLSNTKIEDKVLIYPNPAQQEVSVDFEISDRSLVEVQVFNIVGEKQGIYFNKNLSLGKHVVSLDLTSLESGLYLVEIRNKETVTTKTLVVK